MIFLYIILTIAALYLGFGALYQLLYSVAGLFPAPQPVPKDQKLRRFAVFIAAYKEDGVIVQTAKRALRQRYPQELFEVIVLADKMSAATIKSLRALPIRVIEMDFEESTKSKSLRAGIHALVDNSYDGAVVLDADNHMAPDFLIQANQYIAAGFRVIQGQRTSPPVTALNETAKWDAISEAVNNHILCAGHHALGFSARLAGSGMIFDYDLYAEIMENVDAIGGFDKVLELKMTQKGESIAYASDAIVYDEKVASPEVFAKQRGRWLAAQYKYCREYFMKALWAAVSKGNFDFFNKALQMALPPRLLLPVSLLFFTTLTLPFSLEWSAVFAGLFLLNVISFALAIPPKLWESASWMLVSKLPQLVWQAVKAVILIPASTKTFYHTPHQETIKTQKQEVHHV